MKKNQQRIFINSILLALMISGAMKSQFADEGSGHRFQNVPVLYSETFKNSNGARWLQSSGGTYTKAQADEMKTKMTTACEGIDIKVTLESEDYMSEERKKYNNSFTESVDLLLEVYKNGDYMKILNPSLIVLIIIIVFTVLVIISTIIFLINVCICCCNGKETGRGCCISCNLVIAFIGLVGFGASCIAIAIFVSNVKTGMNEVNCTLHIISNDIINGNKSVENFMGFFPLTEVLNQYITDFDKLVNNHKTNLEDIKNLQLKTASQSALDSLGTFCSDCSTKKTTDGEGTLSTPHSVSDVFNGLKTGADAEFKGLNDICKVVEDGAVSGVDQVNNPDIQSVLDSIKDVVNMVTGIISTFDSSFGSIGNTYSTIDGSYNIAQIVFIIFCFMCLLIAILIFIGLCCAYNNKGCDKFCCCRIIIAVLAIFCFIFMLFSFVIGVVTFATSTSCGMIQQFSSEAGIDNFISLFSFDDQMTKILKTCLLESGNGSITEIFMGDSASTSTSMFDQVQELLDMFTVYLEFYDKLPQDKMSVAFTEYKKAIEEFKKGTLPDHNNVPVSLASLNNIVNCDATSEYSLTTESCPDGKTCKAIKDTATYTAPGCQGDAAENTKATKLFDDLKKYITETETLIDELLTKTYSTTSAPSTPNKLYNETILKFDTAVTKLNLIKTDLATTISLIQSNNLQEGTNCKILRAEFQTLEKTLCFGFVPNIYKFMLVSFVASIFFFSFLWHFCCGTFCLERSGEHGEDAEVPENYDNTQFNPKGNKNYYN